MDEMLIWLLYEIWEDLYYINQSVNDMKSDLININFNHAKEELKYIKVAIPIYESHLRALRDKLENG